jgi:hypothetical protein
MTPGMITAIAYLIAELAATGVSIASLLEEVKKTGKVPPERWDELIAELDSEVAKWKLKRGS